MRLARHGKKGYAYYHIVVADSRAPRDGRFIERIGSYNPNTDPASIDLDFDRALHWIQTGAQPTDTVRAILSYEGVMMKKHLLGGVKKGALTADQAETKFNAWKADKLAKIQSKVEGLKSKSLDELKARVAAEMAVNQKRIEEQNKRKAEALAATTAVAAAASEEESVQA